MRCGPTAFEKRLILRPRLVNCGPCGSFSIGGRQKAKDSVDSRSSGECNFNSFQFGLFKFSVMLVSFLETMVGSGTNGFHRWDGSSLPPHGFVHNKTV
jgi:hypothetical protein